MACIIFFVSLLYPPSIATYIALPCADIIWHAEVIPLQRGKDLMLRVYWELTGGLESGSVRNHEQKTHNSFSWYYEWLVKFLMMTNDCIRFEVLKYTRNLRGLLNWLSKYWTRSWNATMQNILHYTKYDATLFKTSPCEILDMYRFYLLATRNSMWQNLYQHIQHIY